MKTTYVAGLEHINTRQAMAKHPLLFGVWHGYKMSVLRVYNAYRPLWTALQFTGLLRYPNVVSVLRATDNILTEHMVLAIFLATLRLGNSLRRSIAGGGGAWQVGKSPAAYERILCRLRALQTLITKYAPPLFLMGLNVKQCHWRLHFPDTGFRVKTNCKCSGPSFGGSIDTEVESSTWMPSRWHC